MRLRTTLIVMLLVLLALPSSAAAEPTAAAAQPGNEITISAEVGHEYAPAIAYNSLRDEYLVVWQDAWDVVHGQRLMPNGQLLNRFVVAEGVHGKRQPAVAYDPTRDRYLVTWIYDYWGNDTDWDLYGRFIPWDGPSTSLHDFTICDWTSNQRRPSLDFARTQDEFLAVWTSEATAVPRYVSGRRISADGSGFPDSPFLISSGTEIRDRPDVAYNLARNEYLVTWDLGATDIWGVRLSGTGSVLGGGELVIAAWPSTEEHPSVAACHAADQYLVAWHSDQDTGGTDRAIYARYVSGSGVVGNAYLVDDTTAPEQEVDVSCGAEGQRYFLVWQTMYATAWFGVWGRIAHPAETMEEAFVIIQPGSSHHRLEPAVGGGRGTFLTAWEHEQGFLGERDLHGRAVLLVLLGDGFESGNTAMWSSVSP